MTQPLNLTGGGSGTLLVRRQTHRCYMPVLVVLC
jgi:hypothetical protein